MLGAPVFRDRRVSLAANGGWSHMITWVWSALHPLIIHMTEKLITATVSICLARVTALNMEIFSP